MPLNVIVERDHGRTGEKTVIAKMRIANIAGDTYVADYEVRALDRQGAPITSRVRNHERLTEPVWTLVARALAAVGYKP